MLVLPKGAEGVGKVTKVVGPRMFGQDARIDVDLALFTLLIIPALKYSSVMLPNRQQKQLPVQQVLLSAVW